MSKYSRAFAGAADVLKQVLRLDGWANVVTGIGTSKDRRSFSRVTSIRPILDAELEALYCEDDLAARIVEALPTAALRQFFFTGLLNLGIFVAIVVFYELLGTSVNLWNTFFYLLLITLLVTLYDRYRPEYVARFSKDEGPRAA